MRRREGRTIGKRVGGAPVAAAHDAGLYCATVVRHVAHLRDAHAQRRRHCAWQPPRVRRRALSHAHCNATAAQKEEVQLVHALERQPARHRDRVRGVEARDVPAQRRLRHQCGLNACAASGIGHRAVGEGQRHRLVRDQDEIVQAEERQVVDCAGVKCRHCSRVMACQVLMARHRCQRLVG